MKVEAQFIGADSLGYVHGQTYELAVQNMFISRLDGTGGACIYDTLYSFISNWDNIRQLI